MDRVDAVVVGAGAIGLACGRELALRGLETIVVEASDGIGNGTSSRNSEVVHAGIYDAPGSLKATLCVAGRRLLYPYCESHGVGHRRSGKLIVATTAAQAETLRTIEQRALANDVEGLRWLTGAEARALEPEVNAEAALLSTVTGIIDSHALMLAVLGDLENAGGALVLRSPVERATATRNGFVVEVGGDAPLALATRIVVNAAGLFAPSLARRIDGLDAAHVPRERFAKGNYYALAGRSPFTHLVYPVPEPGGLGVHLTLDLGGQARFGPDVEWLAPDTLPEAIDYAVDPARSELFYAAIRSWWPALKDGALAPAYSGVRPKLQGPGEPVRDFVLQGPEVHGVAGLVNLYGIESPGLTASLAIAALAARRLGL
ncbi:MAG TPA: NAD(P)/FAD-dependent oxidoreductase [Caldimonas sp.]|jgi:L-2-hydroxyglutarate oxidase LhgO|nr:NAD(P)/FAD-dependent oxidoreductase [Caldimonas sp.]HEX4233953.1 NAD(P)/FAD-dependent oxidoreductase [Caldimonas sp.]